MAYDEKTSERVRRLLAARRDVREQPLMGGLCFMVRGHMCVAVSGRGGILVRVGPEAGPEMQNEPHASAMEMRGRIMTGYVRVAPAGYASAAGLKTWVTRATDFVATLPAKEKKPAGKAKVAKKKPAKK